MFRNNLMSLEFSADAKQKIAAACERYPSKKPVVLYALHLAQRDHGHLSDGAMVVLIAHPGGLVSVYAHLDDTFARPPVRIGDPVIAGEVIGFVGLTGITTGPHLHFAVLSGGQPIDPLSLLASR